MRILIDEDTAVQLVEPLRHILIGHQVKHIHELACPLTGLCQIPGSPVTGVTDHILLVI
jgi:hypothetical protein